MYQGVLVCLLALALAACGKGDIAIVKRPLLPIYVCLHLRPDDARHAEGFEERCEGRFDAGQTIGMHFMDAARLAAAHGFTLRREAPLAKHEALTADYLTRRIDVECNGISDNSIVVRIIQQG
jgi:hypothetical protein